MEKKGEMSADTLRILVLCVIVAAIFIGVVVTIFSYANNMIDKEACKESVRQNAFLRLSSIEFGERIKCPAREVVVKDSDQEQIKKTVAKEIYDCYDQYLFGQQLLFDTNRVTTENFCAVCSTIEFKNDVKVDGFVDYLSENGPGNNGKSYYEIITGQDIARTTTIETNTVDSLIDAISGQKLSGKTIDLNSIDSFRTDKKYATIFVYAKKTGGWDRLSQAATGGIAGGGAGALIVIGASTVLTGGVSLIAVIGGAAILGASGYGYGLVTGSDLKVDWQSGVLFIPYDAENLKSIGCTKLPVAQNNK